MIQKHSGKRGDIAIVAAAMAVAAASPALAATGNSNMTVSTTIPTTCALGSVTNIAFANPSGLSVTQTDATGSIAVTCTNGGTYTVGADNGQNYASSTRNMKSTRSGSSAVLSYALYSDSGHSTALTTSASIVGDGSAQTFSIYGRMPAQTATEAGSYTDTVSLTVTY
ncbi:spore coat U domain-containing protein [Sphingomonas sp.]|jgi:spore coat protein U-like protein|uniref:Csu type fimbrial protein n=1 Tax=Sphingomonas sp. TaxID=28214 RepID=UPI0035C7D59C